MAHNRRAGRLPSGPLSEVLRPLTHNAEGRNANKAPLQAHYLHWGGILEICTAGAQQRQACVRNPGRSPTIVAVNPMARPIRTLAIGISSRSRPQTVSP